MINNSPPPAQHTITRTLTITTVETWSITIGWGNAREEAALDRVVDEAESEIVEEET